MPVRIRTSPLDFVEDGARQIINLIAAAWGSCRRVVSQIDANGYVDWITALTAHSEVSRHIRIAMNIRAHPTWPQIAQELARLHGDTTIDFSVELQTVGGLMIAVRDSGYAMLSSAPDFGVISIGDTGPAIQWRQFASPEKDSYEAACRVYLSQVPAPDQSQFQRDVIVP